MGIVGGEQAALQHLVGGGTDARYEVRRIEGRLFNFGESVFRIANQHDSADSDQRVVAMRPDVGRIEGIEAMSRLVSRRHELIVGDRGSAVGCHSLFGFHHCSAPDSRQFTTRENPPDEVWESGGDWSLGHLRRLYASRSLPNPNRLKRLVNLLLRDLLTALHAQHELIDFVALLPEGRVVLISFAGFALHGLGGML